jgi:hypothetical protein
MEKIKHNELDSFTYTFYTHGAYIKARELADIIYKMDPEGITKYTKVNTKMYNYLYSFVVDERELCTFVNISNYEGCSIADIVDTEVVDKLNYIGYEIHMSYLYENMYNPDMKELWPSILETIKTNHRIELYGDNSPKPQHDFVKHSHTHDHKHGHKHGHKHWNKHNKVKGHGDLSTITSEDGPSILNNNEVYESFVEQTIGNHADDMDVSGTGSYNKPIVEIIEHLNKINDKLKPVFLYIGDHYNTPYEQLNRIQLIAAVPKYIIKEIRAVYVEAEYSVSDPMFIGDFRLERYTVYLDGVSIADIYNTCKYESVPYIIKYNMPIATIFLCLKLKLVDIWIIRVMVALKKMEKNTSRNVIRGMYEVYDKLYAQIDLEYGKVEYNYCGIAEDLNIKIMRESGDKIFYPYYPRFRLKNIDSSVAVGGGEYEEC